MLTRDNKILFRKTVLFSSVFQKAKGLMFSKKINDAYIFIFENKRRMDMHMFFVFFPIDIIFLDENMKIIELKEHFLPFTFFYSKEKAKYVIEVPDKSIEKYNLRVGESLKFKQ